jgi:poly(3-hydroxybutyrate) depolymerase
VTRPPCSDWLALSLVALLAAACGGGGSNDASPAGPPPRGTLLQLPPHLESTIAAGTLLAELSLAANQQVLTLGGIPLCDIAIYHIEYETVGGKNEATTASAALMVPAGVDPRCRGGRPILLYAHGTTVSQAFNIADLQDPANAEGLLLAAFFASQGYIVVAPNYTGYDTSTLPYHPYLIADAQANDMIDALTAARTALPLASALVTKDNGRLFITGYSQGGYVAMATHRALQALGQPVIASAPMSGPYAMAAFVDAMFEGEVNTDGTVTSAFLINSYQDAYGNIYSGPTDVFSASYASGIQNLLPTTIARSQLYAQGKLPEFALFDPTTPAAAYAGMTPATSPALFAPIFAMGFGTGNLVTNAYRLSYLNDATQNPDGGFPVVTTGVPAASPAVGLRQALKVNDLRGWNPTAPILLCGGDEDPTVFFLNTQLVADYWTTHTPAPTAATILDLDASVSTGPYASLHTGFEVAKGIVAASAIAKGATDGGAAAVLDVYHTTLVPPFCLAAVVSFFSAQP